MKTSLCWMCRNAVPGPDSGCCWSRKLKPVPGWTAEPMTHHGSNSKGFYYTDRSFLVIGCPEFKADCTPDDLDHSPREELFPAGVVYIDCDTGKKFRTGMAAGRYMLKTGKTINATSAASRLREKALEASGKPFNLLGITWRTEPAEFKMRTGSKPLFCITTGIIYPTLYEAACYIAAVAGIGCETARALVLSKSKKGEEFELAGLRWRPIKEVE